VASINNNERKEISMSVKKRYRLLTILSVLVVSVGGILTWRAAAVTVLPAGYDEFNTIGSGGTSEPWSSLPAGFFKNKEGFGSDAVPSSTPTFTGRNPVPGFTGDTVIERTNSVSVPGSTALVVTGLRFVGESDLTVSFSQGGTSSVTYTVLVDESGIAPSTGDMTFNSDGTYTSTLAINRKYTFVPTDASQPTRTADSTTERDSGGNLIFPAIDLTGTGTWSAPSGSSASPAIQAQSATTGGTTGGGSVPVASPTPNKCFIKPGSEAALFAKHGILPAGCPTPSPSPSPSPAPSVTPKPITGM
jgi:hypothetical protein